MVLGCCLVLLSARGSDVLIEKAHVLGKQHSVMSYNAVHHECNVKSKVHVK